MRLSLRLPSEEALRAFVREHAACEPSYELPGCTRGEVPSGYDFDHYRVALGRGEATFRAACDAVRAWHMFPSPWTRVFPTTAIEVGSVVAVLVRVFGVWVINACRIVYILDEVDTPARRFGFAYGTLPTHAEQGEERFSVEWAPDDVVYYDVQAVSRPRWWLARLGAPVVRRLQRRFGAESLRSMQAAVKVVT